jgi:hypothetical protein
MDFFKLSYKISSSLETDGNTFLMAFSKSVFEIINSSISSERLIAMTEASLRSILKSAPENLWQSGEKAIDFKSTSSAIGLFFHKVFKILNLSLLLGKGTYSSLSSLPGLNIALSIISGLFVAAMTKTFLLSSSPSISVSN